jgi:rare lipoprotein A
VRVTSLESGKSVVVRINDRGPFSPKYKLDMSPAAAQKIGLNFTKGTMSVRIERLKKASQKSESLAAQ